MKSYYSNVVRQRPVWEILGLFSTQSHWYHYSCRYQA